MDKGSSILGIIGLLLGGLVFFYKSKADKAQAGAILGETKGKDEMLKRNQDSVESDIKKIDQDIKKMYEDHDKPKTDSDKQGRADKWGK